MITIKELAGLIKEIKAEIQDDYRAFDEDEIPGIQLTISTDETGTEFGYQTGDNSFSGGCYGHPIWAVQGIYKDTNCRKLARDMLGELDWQVTEYRESTFK